MKTKITALWVMLLLAGSLSAQEPRFLFEEGKMFLSGFGGPLTEFTTIENDFAICNGGGGALMINQTLFIGGYGMGLSTSHYLPEMSDVVNIDIPKLYFNHGGLWIGYIHQHYKPVHFGISLKLGGGEISMVDRYFHYTPLDERKGVDMVMVVTPQLELELSLTRWMKLNCGLGYRYVGGVDKLYEKVGQEPELYYNQSDFNSPMVSVGFLFGWFNQGKIETKEE